MTLAPVAPIKPVGKGSKQSPYKVVGSIVPNPGKLVSPIHTLEYVDMQELLPGNLALVEHLVALPQGLASKQREFAGGKALMTWVSSFATYVTIVAEVHPSKVWGLAGLHAPGGARRDQVWGQWGGLTYNEWLQSNCLLHTRLCNKQ